MKQVDSSKAAPSFWHWKWWVNVPMVPGDCTVGHEWVPNEISGCLWSQHQAGRGCFVTLARLQYDQHWPNTWILYCREGNNKVVIDGNVNIDAMLRYLRLPSYNIQAISWCSLTWVRCNDMFICHLKVFNLPWCQYSKTPPLLLSTDLSPPFSLLSNSLSQELYSASVEVVVVCVISLCFVLDS